VPPLEIDTEIAKKAQLYAKKISDAGKLEHSAKSDRDGCGENIYEYTGLKDNELMLSDIASESWYN
jgi:uncharacterized protein YkwD